jgi:hypothetical protein
MAPRLLQFALRVLGRLAAAALLLAALLLPFWALDFPASLQEFGRSDPQPARCAPPDAATLAFFQHGLDAGAKAGVQKMADGRRPRADEGDGRDSPLLLWDRDDLFSYGLSLDPTEGNWSNAVKRAR